MYKIEYVENSAEYMISVPSFDIAEVIAESLYFEHGAECVTVYNPNGECIGEF